MTDEQRYDRELVSVMAHDLRTPIISVQGFIQVAIMAGELNERQLAMLEKAMVALERMDVLITDVLDMAQAGSTAALKRTDCDLSLIVNEAVSLVEGAAQQRQVTFHLNIPDDLPIIQAEPQRIRQAVNNLVGNAVKYNREGGSVRVALSHTPEAVTLVVADTGYGIAPEDLPNIFDPFYRSEVGRGRSVKGNGLGLAIVKAIVSRHGGEIHVESRVNDGATFTMRLPIAE